MQRLDCIKALFSMLGDSDVVVATLGGLSREISTFVHRDLNFYATHGMGSASSIGLGLAIFRPKQRVFILDGDGALLMNLAGLATIANQNPPNLYHIVFDNGLYESVGTVKTATAGRTNLAEMARGAGWEQVSQVADLDQFQAEITRIIQSPGPYFVLARVEKMQGPKPPFDTDSLDNQIRFMDALGKCEV